jgi:transcription initiation factor TFIID TATA-box-binding protein
VNIVASVETGQQFDLSQLGEKLCPDFRVGFRAFGVYAPPYARGKILVYPRGRLVFAGERTVSLVSEACASFFEELGRMGYRISPHPRLTIRNIVAVVDMFRHVDLDELSAGNDPRISYEPEIFPGLFVRDSSTRLTLIVFSSGKVIVTGARSYAGIDCGVGLWTDLGRRAGL